jgi:hypothetical protein
MAEAKKTIEQRIDIMKRIWSEIPDANQRFPIEGRPINRSYCFRAYLPDPGELLQSDIGCLKSDPDMVQEYMEEISLLEQYIEESEFKVGISDWQKSNPQLWGPLNRRAAAMDLWARYAIPWRIRGNFVYLIYPPRDVLGGIPVVRKIEIAKFCLSAFDDLAATKCSYEALQFRIHKWKERLKTFFAWVFWIAAAWAFVLINGPSGG